MSVPRRERTATHGESEAQQRRAVPAGTAISRGEADNRQGLETREVAFSTEVRSVLRNRSRERCVSCVPSAVALRKPAFTLRIDELRTSPLRTPELRTPELRTRELRTVASVYPPASPKDTLKGVFEQMKRAARAEKFRRLSGRLALKSKRSASWAAVDLVFASRRPGAKA